MLFVDTPSEPPRWAISATQGATAAPARAHEVLASLPVDRRVNVIQELDVLSRTSTSRVSRPSLISAGSKPLQEFESMTSASSTPSAAVSTSSSMSPMTSCPSLSSPGPTTTSCSNREI